MLAPNFRKAPGLEHHCCRTHHRSLLELQPIYLLQVQSPSLLPGLFETLWPLPSGVTTLISSMAQICTYTLSGSCWSCRGLDVTLALIPVPSHMTPISFTTILMIPTGFPDGKRNVISTIQMEKVWVFFHRQSLMLVHRSY